MNRQQQRNLRRQMKTHKNAQNKAGGYVKYGQQVREQQVYGGKNYTEVLFNSVGLALHRLHNMDADQVREIWTFCDDMITQYGQTEISADTIKAMAEEEIGISCNYADISEGEDS